VLSFGKGHGGKSSGRKGEGSGVFRLFATLFNRDELMGRVRKNVEKTPTQKFTPQKRANGTRRSLDLNTQSKTFRTVSNAKLKREGGGKKKKTTCSKKSKEGESFTSELGLNNKQREKSESPGLGSKKVEEIVGRQEEKLKKSEVEKWS